MSSSEHCRNGGAGERPSPAKKRNTIRWLVGDAIEARDVVWLWPGRIPLGKLVVLQGDGGVGKSTIAYDLVAHVTTGSPWPDSDVPFEPREALILSAEDDPHDTIKPRLMAAGADDTMYRVLQSVNRGDDEAGFFTLAQDVDALVETLEERPNVGIIVIDPISQYYGAGVSGDKNDEVRRALGPLLMACAEYGVTPIAINHINKGAGQSAQHRGIGSVALNNSARVVYHVGKEPEGDDIVMAPVKFNLPTNRGIRLTIQSVPVQGLTDDIGRIAWGDATDVTADELVSSQANERAATKTDLAATFLLKTLADGPMQATTVQQLSQKDGHAWRTVERAKARAGAIAERVTGADGKVAEWWWSLRVGGVESDDQTAPAYVRLKGGVEGNGNEGGGSPLVGGEVVRPDDQTATPLPIGRDGVDVAEFGIRFASIKPSKKKRRYR